MTRARGPAGVGGLLARKKSDSSESDEDPDAAALGVRLGLRLLPGDSNSAAVLSKRTRVSLDARLVSLALPSLSDLRYGYARDPFRCFDTPRGYVSTR